MLFLVANDIPNEHMDAGTISSLQLTLQTQPSHTFCTEADLSLGYMRCFS